VPQNEDTFCEFEEALKKRKEATYVLRLYVSGATPRSAEAITKIKAVCEEYLPGQYDLEVIDIYKHPEVAVEQQIIAAPTLIKEGPGTWRRLIGNLSNTKLLLQRLGIVS
jgi:circadian clock protein KaiB